MNLLEVTWRSWAEPVIGVVAALLLTWIALVVALLRAKPGRAGLGEGVRLLPDLLRLIGRLAKDPDLPRGVRLRLGLLVAYLACPIDVIPDVIPVLGYADDVIAVLWILRSVVRTVGPEAIRRHWTGTAAGLEVVLRLAGTTRADR